MKPALTCLLLLAAALSSLADDPLPQDQPSPTVRGLALGAAMQDFSAAFPGVGVCVHSIRACTMNGVIGDVRTTDDFFFSDHDELESVAITFATSDYSKMRDAFVGKFGQPLAQHVGTYKNQLGATYEFERISWHGKTMVVILEAYADTKDGVQKGRAYFSSRAAYDAHIAEAEAKRKKALTDF